MNRTVIAIEMDWLIVLFQGNSGAILHLKYGSLLYDDVNYFHIYEIYKNIRGSKIRILTEIMEINAFRLYIYDVRSVSASWKGRRRDALLFIISCIFKYLHSNFSTVGEFQTINIVVLYSSRCMCTSKAKTSEM